MSNYFTPTGIIPPIITPLTDEGEVNYPVLRQMVNHLIDSTIHPIDIHIVSTL